MKYLYVVETWMSDKWTSNLCYYADKIKIFAETLEEATKIAVSVIKNSESSSGNNIFSTYDNVEIVGSHNEASSFAVLHVTGSISPFVEGGRDASYFIEREEDGAWLARLKTIECTRLFHVPMSERKVNVLG